MKHSAFLLMAAAALAGCSTVESIRSGILDAQRPQEDAEVLKYRKLFESGRRAESRGDVRIAGDTYGWLLGRGCRYGEYGLAMLALRREPGSADAVSNLIACAKRSSNASSLFPDSAMDSAFSVAAMAKLADIAVSECDRRDVASSLRGMMSDIVTPQVREWAAGMKSDPASAETYSDVIAAVESSRAVREYVKPFRWDEISAALAGGGGGSAAGGGARAKAPSSYSVVNFVKTPGAACQYDFEVRLNGSGTFDESEKVRSELRRQLVKEYLSANPQDGAGDVRVSFPSWSQIGSTIKGTAAVMKVSAVRIAYDSTTRRGKMAVRLDGRDVASARKWALDNIAELAAGKNVVLVAGKAPPRGASFKTDAERMTDDGLLEIEFSTEE